MTTQKTLDREPLISTLSLPKWQMMGAEQFLGLVATAFVDGFRVLGTANVDYIFTVSHKDEWSDLCLSNQNFFDGHINKALAEAGLKVKVTGRCGGGHSGIRGCIREEFPNFSGGLPYWGCLYRVQRAS